MSGPASVWHRRRRRDVAPSPDQSDRGIGAWPIVHPPSTSQRQLTEAQLADAGITPGLLRVSVGLEDLEDLQADFEAALATLVANGSAADRESAPALRGT